MPKKKKKKKKVRKVEVSAIRERGCYETIVNYTQIVIAFAQRRKKKETK